MYNRQLILEDGTVYKGYAFGADVENVGEVVFNTSMTGYQEILSDPSYNGQIVTLTYPLIGNYGINRDDFESMKPCIKGMIVKEVCTTPSNFRSEKTLDEALKDFGIPGIYGIDTRALTRKLRSKGVVKGRLVSMDKNIDEVVAELKKTILPTNQIEQVSTKSISPALGRGRRVVLVDLGMKIGIVRELVSRGCDVIVVPYNITADEVLRLEPDGVMLTNGPGDPEDAKESIEMIKGIIDKVTIFGICMGHQLVSLACGAKTYKLKFGHRGGNHPVKNILTGRVDITSQNHGYAVDPKSLDPNVAVPAFTNVNDGTNEGLKYVGKNIFTVQYHPEACPGPQDSAYLFDRFINMMGGNN